MAVERAAFSSSFAALTIAVCAEDLESRRKILLDNPSEQLVRSPDRSAMLPALGADVVKLKKAKERCSTARALTTRFPFAVVFENFDAVRYSPCAAVGSVEFFSS